VTLTNDAQGQHQNHLTELELIQPILGENEHEGEHEEKNRSLNKR